MRASSSLALPLLASVAFGQGRVLVVDDDGGPGVDFVSIQAAIAAADDGDVVLVKPGSYAAIEILGKGVEVVADADADVVAASARIAAVPAGAVARLQGLRIAGPGGRGIVEECLGAVWIERCAFLPDPVTHAEFPPLVPALSVRLSSEIVLVGVEAVGQSYDNSVCQQFVSVLPHGEDGLRVEQSTVRAFGSSFRGGDGHTWLSGVSCTFTTGGVGGAGAFVTGGASLYLAGSSVVGGGSTGGSHSLGSYTLDGGDGLQAIGSPGHECSVLVLDSTLAGGPPGWDPFDPAEPGEPYVLEHASLELLPGERLALSASSPAREQSALDLTLDGPPFAPVFLGVAAQPDDLFVPALGAPIALAPPILALALGVIPASGSLALSLPIHDLPPGFESMVFHGQGAYVAAGGAVVVGAPASVVLLDATL